MKVAAAPQFTSLDVMPSARADDAGHQTWVTVSKPADFLDTLAPLEDVLKGLSFDPSPGTPARLCQQYALAGGVVGLTTSGFALARGIRDHDQLGVGLAVTTAALTGLEFMDHALAHIHPGLPVALRVVREAAQAVQDNRIKPKAAGPVVPFEFWASIPSAKT